VVGAVAAIAFLGSSGSHEGTSRPTTGNFAPLTVWRPPIIRVGQVVMNDPDSPPQVWLFTVMKPLPARRHYEVTLQNASSVGFINSLQWFPPGGAHVVKLLGSSSGHCTVGGVTGFGGNQFKGLLLYPSIRCYKLQLKPPSCSCK